MRRNNIKWLYEELPKLVSEGILPEENAGRIKEYYGDLNETNWLRTALGIFGTLGSVLIGGGIILLFARNWEQLSVPVRTILSFLPLIIGQILVGWVLLKRNESFVWREATSAFLVLAIGAAISLIGQTYHIPGDMPGFLLSWMLLSLPVVYLMDVTLPAIFYLAGITAWAGFVQSEGGYAVLYWILFAALGVFIYKSFRNRALSNRSVFLSWAVVINFCIALGIVLEKVLPGLWIVVYSSYFSALYLAGRLVFNDAESFWQKPFQNVGVGGMLVISYMLTYENFWRDIGWQFYRHEARFNEYAGVFDYILVGLLLAAAAYLLYRFMKRKDGFAILYGSSFILTTAAYIAVSLTKYYSLGMILFNAYVFILGVGTVALGIRDRQMGVTNGGMLIISFLILLRFFDNSMGFVERGVSFILVGIGFLVSNVLLLKRRKGVKV